MMHSINIVYSNLGLGGIPYSIVDIVNDLAFSHPKTKVSVLVRKHNEFDLRSSIQNHNVSVVDYPFFQVFDNPIFFIFWVWWFIFINNPSVIMSFISPYALTVLATKILFFWRKTPIIINEAHFTSTMVKTMIYPKIQELCIKIFYPLATVIIVPTNAIKQNLQFVFKVPAEKILIINNWTRYAKTSKSKTNRIYDCIYIGRFEKTKNIIPLFSILSEIIRNHNPSLSCVFVGDGSEKGEYKKYLKKHKLLNNIRVLPPTTKIDQYLKKSKILIFNPEINTEGFPIAILDAMACGSIVITKYFYGAEEYINTKNGYIVRSTNELSERIIKVLRSYPRQQPIITQAKKDVAVKYSLKNIKFYTKWVI